MIGVKEVYRLQSTVRHFAQQLTFAQATTLAKRILTDAGFPQAEYTEAVQHPSMFGKSSVAWDVDTNPPTPLVALAHDMCDELTVIHECAHILRNGPSYAGRQGDPVIAHDERWLIMFKGLIARYATTRLAKPFHVTFLHVGPRTAAVRLGDLPPPLGESRIPPGTIRCYHYTTEQAVPSIAQNGLLERYARGDSNQGFGNEPSAGIWASTGKPASTGGMKGPDSGQAVVEFWVKPDQVSQRAEYPWNGADVVQWGNSGYHHIIVNGDVKPNQIVAIHQGWHGRARYMQDALKRNPEMREEWEEQFGRPSRGLEDYHQAWTWLKRHSGKRGTFWRVHPEGRAFGDWDASSKPFFEPGSAKEYTGPAERGYSCFENPWHLYLYVLIQWGGAIGDQTTVLRFPGEQVGTGHDGEPLVVPSALPFRTTWGNFCRMLPQQPLPASPVFAPWAQGRPELRSWEALANRWAYLDQERPEQDFIIGRFAGKPDRVGA